MKTKSFEAYQDDLDHFLSKGKNLFLAVFVCSYFYYILFFLRPTNLLHVYIFEVALCVSLGALTVWTCMSTRKYGFLESYVLICFLPFYIFLACINLLASSGKHSLNAKKDYIALAEDFAYELHVQINEVYAGNVLDILMKEDSISVTFEAPYGIKIPQLQIIQQLAPILHVGEKHIKFSEITQRKTQYIITALGLEDYDEYRKRRQTWDNFPELIDRLLLRLPAGNTNQNQPAG